MDKKGISIFGLPQTVSILLIAFALTLLILFIYFLRDRIKDYLEILMNFLGL